MAVTYRLSTGFELANVGPGTGEYDDVCYEAARTGKLGWAYRKNNSRNISCYYDGANGGTTRTFLSANDWACYCGGWSVYFRIKALGTGENQWGAVLGIQQSTSPGVLTMDELGNIKLYSVGDANWAGRTLLATSTTLQLNTWYRLSFGYAHGYVGCCAPPAPGTCIPGPASPTVNIAIHTEAGTSVWNDSVTPTMNSGLGASVNRPACGTLYRAIDGVRLGHEGSMTGANTGLEMDFDDLTLATFYDGPITNATGGDVIFASDWTTFIADTGPTTHYRIPATSVGGSGWGLTNVNQLNPPPYTGATNNRSSTTALAEALAATDALTASGLSGTIKGANLGLGTGNASGANANTYLLSSPTLGSWSYSEIFGSGHKMGVFFPRPFSGATIDDSDAVTYGIRKSNDGTNTVLGTMALEVASSTTLPDPALTSTRYVSGTYTGNDTYQTFNVGAQPSWVFIAPVGAGAPGLIWHDGMVAPHGWASQANFADRFEATTTGFTVRGTATETNASGTTYRYVAICDPTLRFLDRSGYAASPGEASRSVTGSGLLPSLICAQLDQFSTTSSNGGFVKGPGHTGTASSPLIGASATISTGIQSIATTWTSGATTNTRPQTAWAGWTVDLWGASATLWTTTTYTGDGTGTRVIPVSLNGYAPGAVFVFPHNGVGRVRHLSHTGTNSAEFTGSNETTAITAMSTADQFTVGSTLNANGIVYTVLAITAGSSSGGGTPPPSGGSNVVWLDNDSVSSGGCIDTFALGSSSGGNGCVDGMALGTGNSGFAGCVV